MPQLPNKWVAIDTETTGLNPWTGARVFALAIVFPDETHIMRRDGFQNDPDVRRIISDPTIDKVFHNAKFDVRMLGFSGLEVRGKVWDTMILCHLLDGRDRALKLEKAAKKYLPEQFRKLVEEVETWFINHGVTQKQDQDYSRLPHEILEKRVIGDTDLTMRLFKRLYVTVASCFPMLLEQEHRLLSVVQRMEDRGVTIDPQEVQQQQQEYDDMLDQVYDYCETTLKLFGGGFNLNSPKHQRELLEAVGIYHQITGRTKKTKKVQLNDINLRQLRHKAAQMILVGKAAVKMKGTFLTGLSEGAVDGVVHTSFNQLGTITGRFSCSGPNLQNIPIDGGRHTKEDKEADWALTGLKYAPHIKRVIRCRPGFAHIHSDKSQAEVVVLAHYANDQNMIRIISAGESIHTGICRLLYGRVTPELRSRTKTVVFGYIYGAGIEALARQLGGTLDDARDIKHRLGAKLPALPRWRQALKQRVYADGYVTTIHGRRHYVARNKDYVAANSMCQGTVGDEIKTCMVRIDDMLRAEGVDGTILLNIHDDIATEIPIPDLPRIAPMIFDIMNTSPMPFRLPVPSDMSMTVTRWSDKKEVDPNDPTTFPVPLPTTEAENHAMPNTV